MVEAGFPELGALVQATPLLVSFSEPARIPLQRYDWITHEGFKETQ